MITVIIPVLNESATIGEIIRAVWCDPSVSQVIVVDDGSIDGTPAIARQAGAEVITSTLLGKGASMEDGLWASRNEIVLYLDGDLANLNEQLIATMAQPLFDGRADFVKGKFSRASGRVTTLTAKPLLRIFFPELAHFEQPLGGIIAARRSLLRKLRFETDYGVDVGLLIDASASGASVCEADIGHIEHDSHPLEVLGDMATQVVRAILDRADRFKRLSMAHVREVQEVEHRMQAELSVVARRVGAVQRLAVFDMDGVLLRGRYIEYLARRTNRLDELAEYLDHPIMDSITRTERIAALFSDVPKATFEDTAREVPLSPGAAETVVALRAAGFRVGILTDSYHVAAEMVRRRVFADFSIGHLLKFRRGRCTGQVLLSPAMSHDSGCPFHATCKQNALLHLMEKFEIDTSRTVAVGDSDNDICLLRSAGLGIAYAPKTLATRSAASTVVEELEQILEVVAESMPERAESCVAPSAG